jgi:L,D-peptidoglycan transpeptidase YkuD (ErfK/YbiS/YcfS/YnhG family)
MRRPLVRLLVLLTALLSTVVLVPAAPGQAGILGSTLTAGSRMNPGDELRSGNGAYRLVMQGDGNLVMYSAGRAIWWSGTARNSGASLALQSDGNAVIYAAGRALWNTRTQRNPGARMVLQNDANLVVYRANGTAAWASKQGLPIGVSSGDSTQVITVVATSPTATTAQLTSWTPGPQGWVRTYGPVTAWVGASGIGAASESSTRSPAGTHALPTAFGRVANPGTRLPYRVVDRNDWWVSDVGSSLYNTYARCAPGTCSFNEAAGENLYAQGAVYDHAVVIDYNRARTPGAGSAFFLHVANGRPTAGCVAVDRSAMVTLMRWLDPRAKPLIAIGVR